MAQPVFDEHPLQQYFEETGESAQPVPGDFMTEYTSDGAQSPWAGSSRPVPPFFSRLQIPPYMVHTLQSAFALLSSSKSPRSRSSFAEHFKYDVISSSLLSSSLAATPLGPGGRRPLTPDIPGRLDTTSEGEHSRTSSTTVVQSDDESSPSHGPSSREDDAYINFDLNDLSTRRSVGVASVAVLALAAGYEFLAYLLFAVAFYVARAVKAAPDKTTADAATLTLEALNELISAGNLWDSAVNEAMLIVEKDHRNPSAYYGPTSPNSPLSTLRVALQSSLHTTQSQCDSVRELLSALTSPAQLSQMSEMYAPPSPIKPSFISLEHPRPLSDPGASWRRRSMPPSSTLAPMNKRATWNGSLAASLPTSPRNRGRDKDRYQRRSLLYSSFSLDDDDHRNLEVPVTVSAPPSPLPKRVLQDVEEQVDEEEQSDTELPYTKDESVFGVAALNLRRKRQSAGMEAMGLPPPRYTPGHSTHQSLSSTSFVSPSRFTLLQTNRHPLSLSALHLALHGALSAKRYACSHLLALRFEDSEDSEDDAYWEDVRSVMALLTSTFADTSSRLLSALDEAEKKRMKDERPSTESLVGSSRDNSLSPDPKRGSKPMKSMAEMVSFAPMPSHLTRFAAHVDALSTALNDAREHLEQCVASLSSDKESNADVSMIPAADGSLADVFTELSEDVTTNPTLAAYDRFRRELGFALRECERGREQLLNVITTAKFSGPSDDEDDADPVSAIPSLAHDGSSEESAGLESVAEREPPLEVNPSDPARSLDDASEHLLLTSSSEFLPPPGIEQVYEAESGVGASYTRERSKMSREERIRLAKARRESRVVGFALDEEAQSKPAVEQWGPGGEVVQELKDVIWKVGEKRRKLSEQAQGAPVPTVPSFHIDIVDHDASTEVPHSIHPSRPLLEEEAS